MKLISLSCLLATAAAELPLGYPSVPINGVKGTVDMPLVGSGTWQYNDTRAEASVASAFSLGYRHVDTALDYGNQVGIGRALAASGLDRKEFFITTKIPPLNVVDTEAALERNLAELQTDYVDLLLIHFPADSKVARVNQWLALEKWAKRGHARAIGVSHYCRSHVEEVLAVATLPVAVNQNQYHVGMGPNNQQLLHDKAFMESKGILYESYSSLCGPCPAPQNRELITGDLVTGIGARYNKTGAQVALRWLIQQGIPVIPKSSNPAHIATNFDLFDFTLSGVDMASLSSTSYPPETGTPPQAPDDAQECDFESSPF